jgi:hypothetical protein
VSSRLTCCTKPAHIAMHVCVGHGGHKDCMPVHLRPGRWRRDCGVCMWHRGHQEITDNPLFYTFFHSFLLLHCSSFRWICICYPRYVLHNKNCISFRLHICTRRCKSRLMSVLSKIGDNSLVSQTNHFIEEKIVLYREHLTAHQVIDSP